MAENIEKGDVVQLKSGGPKMTVTETKDRYGNVACVWFDGTKQVYGSFPMETLNKVN